MADRNTHIENFNIRVYGIWVHDERVLIAQESRMKMNMVKFPGGGLEKGEGLQDCLKREVKEELDLEAEVGDLFYVNPFFQQSSFRKKDQLISFYYLYTVKDSDRFARLIANTKSYGPEDEVNFRWIALEALDENIFTFPIDRLVVEKLKKANRL